MASLIPAADRAPSLASRVVTIHSTNVTEGAPAPGKYQFSLPCALRVPADDVILQPGAVTVGLTDGRGEVRLPVYSTDVTTTDGSTDWVIVVTPPKGGSYAIRVPSGTSSISLADLPAVRPLTRRESAYAITSVGVTVTEATNAGGSASYANGVLDFKIQVPSFKPSTVYPYIDQTADARAQVYRDEVLDDVDDRLAEVTTAYEVAVAQGYTGTISQWLASLVGPRGPVGEVTVNEPAPGVWDIVSQPIDMGVNDVTGLADRLAGLEYRSGLRNVASLAGAGWSDVQATVWRAGPGVNIAVNRLGRTTASTGTENVFTLPAGYRPPDTIVVRTGRGMVARILTSGAVQVIAPGVSVDYFAISFDTLQPPATTEPGTPA